MTITVRVMEKMNGWPTTDKQYNPPQLTLRRRVLATDLVVRRTTYYRPTSLPLANGQHYFGRCSEPKIIDWYYMNKSYQLPNTILVSIFWYFITFDSSCNVWLTKYPFELDCTTACTTASMKRIHVNLVCLWKCQRQSLEPL